MKRMVSHMQEYNKAYSLKIAMLFVEPDRVDITVPQYYACELANSKFLVGYGLSGK